MMTLTRGVGAVTPTEKSVVEANNWVHTSQPRTSSRLPVMVVIGLNALKTLVMRTKKKEFTYVSTWQKVVAMKGTLPLSAQLPSALPCTSVPHLEGGKISPIRLNDGEVHGPYGRY